MRSYALVSAAFFSALAIVQLVRVVSGWSVRVDTFNVPVAASVFAFLVAASLAIWGFRTSRGGA